MTRAQAENGMRILLVTAIRDEGPFLVEWVAWHRVLGFSDFLIFSNDCSDGSDMLLEALAPAGVIHQRHQAPPGKSVQWQALNAAWRHPLRKAADWMLFSDVDEFPVIHSGQGRIADLLAALPEDTDAVALAWRLFGNAGHDQPPEGPVIAEFTRSAPKDMIHPISATLFKTLFRPASFAKIGVHRPRHRAGSNPRWYDGSGRALPPGIASDDRRISLVGVQDHRQLAELHHYSVKSAQSYLVKSRRGLPNRSSKPVDLGYWIERNYNSEANTAALRYLPLLEAEMARLRALPGVGEAEERARDWHCAEFDRLVREEAGYRLYCGTLHAGSSQPLNAQKEIALYQLFQDVG
ncbi:MAG: glycosyltransferase family 2 protein [Pseudorhodobacter sp.]